MKKKVVILVVILIFGILGFIICSLITSKIDTIPKNYKLKLENNQSFVDGPDTTYYIYDNKIIAEIKTYYPAGHPKGTTQHTIIIYDNVNTNKIKDINDVDNLISTKQGKKVYDVCN